MADDALAEKVFNFICGSGGFAELSFLLKDSSPLKNITTELEKKNWLKSKARGRFVLVKDDNDEIAGVRIDLRKKICQQYLSRGSCPRTQGKCKFWHICKSFIEGNCDCKCNCSHDFFDPDNKGKTNELGIEKHSNGTVRNIVAWSLPQVCKMYLSDECKSDKCPYLHVCSKVVRGSPCDCALSHNITDSHNKKILKQYDLVPHQSMRIAFVRSSILILEEQRIFGKCERSISAGIIKNKTGASVPVKNSTEVMTPAATVQPLAKKPLSLLPKQGENDAQIERSKKSQATANNTTRGSKQNKRESNLLSETGNTRKQQKLEMAKCQQTEMKDQDSVINNLASVSTATTPCKNSLEFLNIQAEEDGNCSDSSSEENKTTFDSLKPLKGSSEENTHARLAGKSQLAYHVTSTSSPIRLSAAKSSFYELNSGGTCESGEKEGLVNSCGRTDDPIVFGAQNNGDKRSSVVAPSGLPASDGSNDFVKAWVMGSDKIEQSSGVKESHSMNALPKVAEVEHRQRKLSISSSCSSVPDPQKCTPSKKAVFDCIVEEYNGTVSFDAISSRQELFPLGCGDVAAWFKARKDSFLLRESKEGKLLEVSSFCKRARLCFRQQACSTKNCQYLHVCRDYIAGFCRFGDRCQRNHSFKYDEDRKLLSKLRLNGLSENNLRKVIQLSIPQVCLDYNEGDCTRDQSCGRIHICKDMIKKKCEDENDCGFQHQKALLTPHSTAILENYGLKIRDGNINPVLRVLLVCEEKPTGKSNDRRETTILAENISVSARANVGKGTFRSVPAPPKNGSVISCEPSEQKVFECLCKEYDCSVSFSVIAKRPDLFPNEFKDIESWFRRKKGSFRLTENDRGIIVQVDAFSAKARLCFSYNNVSGTCNKESCSYLHVCRDYVTDSCRDGATCIRNHHFHNEKDKALLSRIKLDQLTDKQLSRLVLSSVPQVCVEYNHGICDRGEDCPKIHICSDHLKKCHGEGYDCELYHEAAMTCNHTQTILERYHMEHLKSDVVKRIVLVYDRDSIKVKDAGHVHGNKPDTPICSDFILGKCKKGFKCPGHHCSLPFHWQYKLPDHEWKSFNETDNEKLEKLYCDVTLDNCSATGFQISLGSDFFQLLDEGDDVDFLLENKLMMLQKDFCVMADIRRLSSESYASKPGNPVATAWTWYWQNESGIWLQYDVDHLDRDLQQSIEDAFLSKTNCYSFRISGQDYRLYFCSKPEMATEMYQENVRYGTRKEVRRRPADFRSREDLQQLKRSHKSASANQKAGKSATSANVPSQWSSMPSDKQYRRVPVTSTSSEYKEMETLFKKTVDKSVVIQGIERVQNPFMWEKYQRKKENMLAVKTGGQKRIFLNEKRLFHGTSPETVEAICKQNFDWRLHGKNATVYGEGSYFALNASYSDAYAKEDANSCRFMFVAKVLVGSYTKGHSSYRRPPQKDPSNPASDLYDSCVDDKSNPTIFVVFDTDQFYPEYVIRYSHESAWHSVGYQAAHGGYQQPIAKKPVPKPRLPKAAPLQSGASQSHATRTAAISRSSSTPATSVYSSPSRISAGYSSGLNVTGVSSYSTTSGSNSGSSSGYNTSSTSNAASTRHQSTATRSHSGASNSYYSSSASGTSSTMYQSATSAAYSGTSSDYYTSSPSSTSSTRYHTTTSRSNPYGPSTQSGKIYHSSSKDKSKCSVM